MKTPFDISQIIDSGLIQNELDFERALIAERKWRILAKEFPGLKSKRERLRNIIEQYEKVNWSSNSKISDQKLQESDEAELNAERERQFILKRRDIIRKKLNNLDLSQQDFGKILGHRSKSYISELINGVSPFTMKDIVVIHKILDISLNDLVPTFLHQNEKLKIRRTIASMDNPRLKAKKLNSSL